MNKNITKKHIDTILFPKDGDFVQVLDNHWWVVTPENEILLFDGHSPQCNSNEEIAKSIKKRLYPECELKLISRAYVPISCAYAKIL